MYISKLSIKNLRVFGECEVEFNLPHDKNQQSEFSEFSNVNLILGDNGSGKTTILRAIALTAIAPILQSSGYVPYSMVRRGKEGDENLHAHLNGIFKMHGQDAGPSFGTNPFEAPLDFDLQIKRRGSNEVVEGKTLWAPAPNGESVQEMTMEMFNDESPAFLILGYGATRRTEKPENYDEAARTRQVLRFRRIVSLFEDSYSLIPLGSWLPKLRIERPNRFVEVVTILNSLLPQPFGFEGEYSKGEYLFSQADLQIPFGALSDGYRAFIGWVADMLYHICMGCPNETKLVENRGMVLLDEVDLHLHPSWQREVIVSLSKALPLMQFIFTTHSPLVTGSVPAQNIIRFELDGNTSRRLDNTENVYGKSADQILTSEYFGLESTRAPGAQQRLEDLNRKALHGDLDASRELLKVLSRGIEPEAVITK